jgi:hypothetical protein
VNRSAPDSPSPITPADPRISEWIDGRLDDRAAAEVEREVRASVDLARVADDLRALKAALGRIDDGPAPAGFVRGVMDAITIPPGTDDAPIAAEWRRLEAERIAEEREEAHEDEVVAAPHQTRSRWPWLALAGALAAGVLVAVVLDFPRTDREVAMAPAPAGDAWAIPRSRAPADAPQERAGRDFAEEVLADKPASPAVPEPAPAAAAPPAAAKALAGKEAPAARLKEADKLAPADEEIEIVVNASQGKGAVEQLLAASGIVVGHAAGGRGDVGRLGAAAAGAADRDATLFDERGQDRASPSAEASSRDAERRSAAAEPAGERIEVVASPAAIDAFLAAVEARAEGREPVRLRSRRALGQAREAAAGEKKQERQEASRRFVIRVVIEEQAESAPPAPTGPSPGQLEE